MIHSPVPDVTVDRPVMRMAWDKLTFLHWPYSPDIVQKLVPTDLTVETFGGQAWVGLIPFQMTVRFPLIGTVPGISVFPETNVRTYVQAADGTRGVYFFSLEADRLSAVLAARGFYRLPYMWSKMSLTQAGDVIAYESTRRWPSPRGAASAVAIRYDRNPADDWTELDHWLTARWRLYSTIAGRVWGARAWHEKWPLHRASLLQLDDQLVGATGLPAPDQMPLVHYSPGVDVAVSLPARVEQ